MSLRFSFTPSPKSLAPLPNGTYNPDMKFDPDIHHHRSIRLKGYDYSQAGAYFVTIVAWQREMLFGEIVDGEMILNDFGKIVSEKWQWLETQYEYVELGAWIVMPNHFHGILVIHDSGRGGSRSAPTPIKREPLKLSKKWGNLTTNATRRGFICQRTLCQNTNQAMKIKW